jgi:two-component system invasion response regulator UvrY
MLSMHPESRYAVQVLRSGASGYVQKEALATDLVSAINTILRGHKYISYGVAELLTTDPVDSEKPLHETLSQREYEIFYKLGLALELFPVAFDDVPIHIFLLYGDGTSA